MSTGCQAAAVLNLWELQQTLVKSVLLQSLTSTSEWINMLNTIETRTDLISVHYALWNPLAGDYVMDN